MIFVKTRWQYALASKDVKKATDSKGIIMNSNWFKLVMKGTKVKYGKKRLLKGVPIIFNKGGVMLTIGNNCTIKSFSLNLVGLYSRTIIV